MQIRLSLVTYFVFHFQKKKKKNWEYKEKIIIFLYFLNQKHV